MIKMSLRRTKVKARKIRVILRIMYLTAKMPKKVPMQLSVKQMTRMTKKSKTSWMHLRTIVKARKVQRTKVKASKVHRRTIVKAPKVQRSIRIMRREVSLKTHLGWFARIRSEAQGHLEFTRPNDLTCYCTFR